VILSESGLDEVAQTPYVLPMSQGSTGKTIVKLVDFAPRNFHTHVDVTSTIPAIRETHSTTGICPKIPSQVR
jgi:hypothetical protein